MKKNIFIVTVFLLVLVGCLCGCKKDDKVTKDDKSNFPEWLVTKIDIIENSNDSVIGTVRIFKGEWNNSITYFIENNLSSCMFCDVYYENGEKVIFTEDAVYNFSTVTKNWELVYEFGKGLK